jgi:exopolysaccharide biosynthesis polyprenyl glycosylphosphotransferase
MLKRQARVVAAGVFATDLAIAAGSLPLAYSLYQSVDPLLPRPFGTLHGLDVYLWLLLFIVPVWAILLQAGGLYQSHRTASAGREAWRLLRVTAVGGVALFAFIALSKSGFISRPLVALFVGLDALLRLGLHGALRFAARRSRERGWNFRTVLIVGTGEKARALARRIGEHRHWGLRFLGFASEGGADAPAPAPDEGPVLGATGELPRLIRENVVDEVLVAVERDRIGGLEALFLHCEQVGVNARLVADFFPHLIAKVELDDLDGVPLLTFSTTPRDAWGLAAKRAMDLVGAALFLALFSWLYLLIAVLIKATSRGPIVFRQDRVGLNGRRFDFYKFRSMVEDAEARRAEVEHLNEMDGPVFKATDDPRITPVGRWLRKFSLDELPQMWNVLTGEMSLVGPRPPVPSEVERYAPWQRRRLSMRPGLTCLWQVSGRNDVDFQTWMEMDLAYIDAWSLGLDLVILIKTVPAVLFGRGAR